MLTVLSITVAISFLRLGTNSEAKFKIYKNHKHHYSKTWRKRKKKNVQYISAVPTFKHLTAPHKNVNYISAAPTVEHLSALHTHFQYILAVPIFDHLTALHTNHFNPSKLESV